MKTYIFSNCTKSSIPTYARRLLEHVPVDARLILLNKGNNSILL